jgi:hypothetical protein
MSEAVLTEPRSVPRFAEEPQRPARKSQPPQFPNRLTVCFADDQIENPQQVKKAFRASESFVLRMAFDTFCRTNGFVNGGPTDGR